MGKYTEIAELNQHFFCEIAELNQHFFCEIAELNQHFFREIAELNQHSFIRKPIRLSLTRLRMKGICFDSVRFMYL